MGLIGSVGTVLLGPGSSGNAPGQIAKQEPVAEEPTPVVEETAPAEDPTPAPAANSGVGTSYAVYKLQQSQRVEETSSVRDYEIDSRDDKVIAVDWARRAAIAAQSEIKTDALIEGLQAETPESDTFSLVKSDKEEGAAAYGKSEKSLHPSDKAEMRA